MRSKVGEAQVPTTTCKEWCAPDWCTAAGSGGHHRSAEIAVDAVGLEACSAALSLAQQRDGGEPLLMVEVLADPDISAALGLEAEAEAYVFTLRQGRQIREALDRLIRSGEQR